jgi:hypothetical protein
MAVTARFYVAEITRRASAAMSGYAAPVPLGEVVMRPAYKDGANKEWASATPSGEFKMTVRGEALPWFEDRLGKNLHITIEDAPEPE